jgi:UDP-N-acetylglucosamine:LPS N-acetylglucosamine transferase
MQTDKPVVLILTTHTGGGHLNLSHALKDMLEASYQVVIIDPQTEFVDRWYAAVSRYFIPFLKWQYICTDNEIASKWLHYINTSSILQRTLTIIEQVQPQLIITTHAFLSFATARAIERSQKKIPLVFQLTDLGRLHVTWFAEKHASAYFAPTREIYAQTLEQGIDKERVFLTGRPIRSQFLHTSSDERSSILTEFGFDPSVLTIFLQGGAKGSASVDRTIERWLCVHAPIQIILATGNNRSMASRYAGSKQVKTVSFTERIAPYMAVADVIAGKAGASFITEAFMLEKPFIATAFIPGQETPNLHFIKQHNLGWVCLETENQQTLLTQIANQPEMIAEKVESIRNYKAWNMQANQNILPIIDRLLSESAIC